MFRRVQLSTRNHTMNTKTGWTPAGQFPRRRNTSIRTVAALALGLWVGCLLPDPPANGQEIKAAPAPNTHAMIRVGAAQAKRRTIDYRLKPADVLAEVDKTLNDLEVIIHQAGVAKCQALALPEDTLGLLDWIGMNSAAAKQVLPEAVSRMLDRLGRAAGSHHMYLIVCSDFLEQDGGLYNTAFFLSRDGQEIGRYHKVCPTWPESGRESAGGRCRCSPRPISAPWAC